MRFFILVSGFTLLGACTVSPYSGQSPGAGPATYHTTTTHTTAHSTPNHNNTATLEKQPPPMRCFSSTRTRTKHYSALENLQRKLQLAAHQQPAFTDYANFMRSQHSQHTTHCNQEKPKRPAHEMPFDHAKYHMLLANLYKTLDSRQQHVLNQHMKSHMRAKTPSRGHKQAPNKDANIKYYKH